MRFLRRFTPVLVAVTALTAPATASSLGLEQVGSFSSPVYVTSPPGDPRLFVVERAGTIQVLHDGTRSQFLDIHTMVDTDGERGLLSMAFDPSYAANGLFYVFFNDNGTAGAPVGDIHVDEFRVSPNPNVADPGSRRRVLTVNRGTSASNHNGGQLQFGKDRRLYISVGDAANGSNAQNPANLNGKILRIDPHAGGAPQVWSLGLRNPFRFSFDHLTGDLVIGDVGANSFEEIDLAPSAAGLGRGVNFGWPSCEGFSGTGCGSTYANPVFAYPHTDPGGGQANGCAIIGGFVYRGTQIPEISGRYVYTDLCTGELRSIQLGLPLASGDRFEGSPLLSSPDSFGEDASCELYVTNGNAVDKIVGSGSASVAPACLLTLDLEAKKQPLRKKFKFFATTSADSTLVATGKAIKQTTKKLASNQKTKVKVTLKRAKRKRLQKKLENKSRAKVKVKVKVKATDQSGATATDKIKVKLKG